MNIPDGEESNLIKKRNVMYRSVYDYIHNHAMNVANHVTHTSMISPKSRFSFKRENQNEFAKAYCDDVYINRNKQLGITEIPLGKMPLICDVDLQVPAHAHGDDNAKLYTRKHVLAFIKIVQTIILDICINVHANMLYAILLEKPGYIKSNTFKNGFHVHFPNLIVEKTVYQLIIYPRILAALKAQDIFADIYDDTKPVYDSILDAACFRNPWLMYGSRKSVDADAYTISYIVNDKLTVINDLDDVYDFLKTSVVTFWPEGRILHFTEPVEYYLPLILTIHALYKDPISVKPSIMWDVTMSSSSKRAPVTYFGEPLVEKQQRTTQQLNDDLTVLRELLPLLSQHRTDDYSEWIHTGWLIYNISGGTVDGYDMWIEFSRRSPKFDETQCAKIWNDATDRGLTVGSLCYYASVDSPDRYLEWRRNRVIERTNVLNDMSKFSSHSDVAVILHDLYKSKYVCASITKRIWYEFTDHRWVQIEEGTTLRSRITHDIESILTMVEKSLRDQSAATPNDEFVVKMNSERLKYIQKIRSNIKNSTYKNHVMREAAELFYDSKFVEKLDANPFLIGYRRGVIDLQTNMKRASCPDDYMSMQMNIECKEFGPNDPEVKAVEEFLIQIFPDDAVRKYVMDVYCDVFVGGNRHKHAMFWSGDGDNGKSVTEAFFEKMLGSYAIKLPTSLVTGKRTQSSAACPELARAGNGVRWALLQEPDSTDVLNVGILKELTGNDSMFVRGLYKEGTEIKPLFKLVFVCNEPPKIPFSDKATWNRIRVIPFESTFTDDAPDDKEEQLEQRRFKKDRYFEDKLPGMIEAFAWVLLEHRRRIIFNGTYDKLFEPEKVTEATASYKSRNDVYMQFINDCIVSRDGAVLLVNVAYACFKEWYVMTISPKNVPTKIDFKYYIVAYLGPLKQNQWHGWSLGTIESANEDDGAQIDSGAQLDPEI